MAQRGGAELSDQIAALQDSVQDLTETVEHMARRSARSAGRSVWDGYDSAQDAVSDSVAYAQDLAYDTARRGRRIVEDNPGPVVAAAAGIVGLLILGYLWERGVFTAPQSERGNGRGAGSSGSGK